MSKRPTYLKAVIESLGTMLKGLRLTGKHYVKGYDRAAPLGIAHPDYFQKDQGPITIQYPQEKVPVPDNGRYRLFMETDDCIGCDKCARICPVDCITIETFRADGDLGRTSDGTVKRLHLPTFDIDMAKCMYCGLCTTVCPTECLTMTPVYDYSEYDRDNFVYHFGAYSPEEEGRIRVETEASLAAKKAAKTTPAEVKAEAQEKIPATETPAPRPRPRPVVKPAEAPVTAEEKQIPPQTETESQETPVARPRPRPVMQSKTESGVSEKVEPIAPKAEENAESTPTDAPVAPKARPRPIMKPKTEASGGEEREPISPKTGENAESTPTDAPVSPKPRPRPIMKPKTESSGSEEREPIVPKAEENAESTPTDLPVAPKGRPRPIMKPKTESIGSEEREPIVLKAEENAESTPTDLPVAPKGRPRPIMKPKTTESDVSVSEEKKEGGPEA